MLILHKRRFCLRHPEIRDVCDIGQYLFGNSKIAWWATAVMFLLNNTFIQVTLTFFLSFPNLTICRVYTVWSAPSTLIPCLGMRLARSSLHVLSRSFHSSFLCPEHSADFPTWLQYLHFSLLFQSCWLPSSPVLSLILQATPRHWASPL